MKNVEIYSDYIKLGQFLKITGLISTGGETKYFLDNNDIFVNEIKENRKGRKLYKGDILLIKGESYKIC